MRADRPPTCSRDLRVARSGARPRRDGCPSAAGDRAQLLGRLTANLTAEPVDVGGRTWTEVESTPSSPDAVDVDGLPWTTSQGLLTRGVHRRGDRSAAGAPSMLSLGGGRPPMRDSGRRPRARCERAPSAAHTSVPPAGIEPATHGLGNRCATWDGAIARSSESVPLTAAVREESNHFGRATVFRTNSREERQAVPCHC